MFISPFLEISCGLISGRSVLFLHQFQHQKSSLNSQKHKNFPLPLCTMSDSCPKNKSIFHHFYKFIRMFSEFAHRQQRFTLSRVQHIRGSPVHHTHTLARLSHTLAERVGPRVGVRGAAPGRRPRPPTASRAAAASPPRRPRTATPLRKGGGGYQAGLGRTR